MTKFLIFTILIFCFSSCSLFIDNFEEDLLTKTEVKPLALPDKKFCKKDQSSIIISENRPSQLEFKTFIKKIEKYNRLKFIDKMVIWSLIQMNLRPDIASPTARFQALYKINNKEYYLNSFSSKPHQYPYLYALKSLLKKHQSKYSLKKLARLIDSHYEGKFLVSYEFEAFLEKNKTNIMESKILKPIFTRGDETLRENERIPKLKLTRIISSLEAGSKITFSNEKLFKFQNDSFLTPKCNFNMKLYDESLFLINNNEIQSHIFGLKEKQNAYMAMTTQSLDQIKAIKGSFLFEGKSNTRPGAICSFSHRKWKTNTLWLFSTDSRDPGQHIYHLLQYGLEGIKELEKLDQLLSFSRHLFLKNPMRLVIESRRSTKSQIEELLKLNTPIYNAKKLGKVWGYLETPQAASFILDERKHGFIQCNSK